MIWLVMEGGLMKFFGKGTTIRDIVDQDEKRDMLVRFFLHNIHNKYNVYFYGFILCEFLNVLVATSVLFLTNRFLNHSFLLYGLKVSMYYRLPEEEQRLQKNPMCDVFPRIASCNYWRWGSAGKQENINAICVLALNMINDKVFLIFWWWLYLLITAGTTRLIFRIFQIRFQFLRFQMINLRMNRYFKRTSKLNKIENYIKQCKLGDWFVLYQLSKNLNRPFFMDLLTKLSGDRPLLGEEEDEEESLLGGCKLVEAKYQDDKLLSQMHRIIHQNPSHLNGEVRAPLCLEEDTGDTFLEMILQPSVMDEVDGGKKEDPSKDV